MDAQTKANLVAWWLQAGVVVLVAAPLPRLLGLWSPRVRMAYWRVVLIGCLLLPLVPQAFVALFGAQAVGVANPVNPLLSPAQLAEILRAAGTKVLVALGPADGSDIWDKVSAIRAELPDLTRVLVVGAGGEEAWEDAVRGMEAVDLDSLAQCLTAMGKIGAAHEETTKRALDHLGEYALMLRVLLAVCRHRLLVVRYHPPRRVFRAQQLAWRLVFQLHH